MCAGRQAGKQARENTVPTWRYGQGTTCDGKDGQPMCGVSAVMPVLACRGLAIRISWER